MARIYVASLSDYNAGRHHGAWIDAEQSAEDISAEIQVILMTSREPIAEEWAIHDYEGFGGLKLSEFESIERVSELGQAIGEHGPAFAAYADNVGADYATVEDFEESYQGEFESEETFAYQLADDVGLFSVYDDFGRKVDVDTLESYFDWSKWTRDLFMGDYTSVQTPDYKVWVFRNC